MANTLPNKLSLEQAIQQSTRPLVEEISSHLDAPGIIGYYSMVGQGVMAIPASEEILKGNDKDQLEYLLQTSVTTSILLEKMEKDYGHGSAMAVQAKQIRTQLDDIYLRTSKKLGANVERGNLTKQLSLMLPENVKVSDEMAGLLLNLPIYYIGAQQINGSGKNVGEVFKGKEDQLVQNYVMGRVYMGLLSAVADKYGDNHNVIQSIKPVAQEISRYVMGIEGHLKQIGYRN